MRKIELDKKSKIKYIFISGIAVLLIAAILTVAFVDSKYGIFPEHNADSDELVYNGEAYVPRYGIETFLLIGLDKQSLDVNADDYRNDSQADFLMLMVFDNVAKTYCAIQINRDTVVRMDRIGINGEIVGSVTKQIALSHNYGSGGKDSCKNVSSAVSNLFYGVDIDHYMSVTLDSVGIINDLVGGVTLEVLEDFSAVDANLGLVKGATVTLNAEQAEAYVRARKDVGDGSNQNRMKRQNQYFEALQKQLDEKAKSDPEFIIDALTQMSDHTITDASSGRLDTLSQKIEEYEFKGIKEIDGNTRVANDMMEFHPNEDAFLKLVVESFYESKEK